MQTKERKGIYIVLTFVLLLVIAAVIFLWFNKNGVKQDNAAQLASETLETPKPSRNVFITVEKEITGEMVQDGLRDMGVLVTSEYYFTQVISYQSIKKLFKTNIKLPFSGSEYIASYDGVVTAGIDFEKVTVVKDEDRMTISIKLPPAQIQNVDIDYDSFVLYSEKEGLGNPISVSDFNDSLIELEKTAKEKAEERGILDKAQTNARMVVKNFVESLTGTDYTIVIQ